MPVARGRRSGRTRPVRPPKVSILTSKNGQTMAPIDALKIQPKFNVRRNTEPDEELYQSIEEHNVLNPIHVRWKDSKEDVLYIVDGERRFRAAKKAKWSEVPVVCRGHLDDRDALIISLSTNEGQLPLTREERAEGFRRLSDAGLSRTDIANVMGCSKRMVSETLLLLDKATMPLRNAALHNGKMSKRAGSRISTLPDKEQKKLMEKLEPKLDQLTTDDILEEVRAVEARLNKDKDNGSSKKKTKAEKRTTKKPEAVKSRTETKADIVDRLGRAERMLTKALKTNSKSREIKAQLELCAVLRGEKSLNSLIRKSQGKRRVPKKGGK